MSELPVYETMPVGVCALRHDRKALDVLYANPALLRLLGHEKAHGDLESFWAGSETAELARKLKGPTPPREAILPFQHAGGGRHWALISITQETWNHEPAHLLWVMDISTSRRAQEELEKAVKKADAAAEQKSNFLATMSHEIRTPMQSVYGLLEMIELEKPPANVLSMARTARASASGLLEILDDILDFAKMDADQMELDHFEVPVRTLARGILEAVEVKVQGKDVDLRDDIAADVPFVIVGDPKRLRQIIMNLIGNALKFTNEGSVTIRITKDVQVIDRPAAGLALRFEIVDTGIGMSKEVAGRLFQPFTQADNSTARKFGGTGLGLSICKKLVELMGGKIGVSSVEGKGSTFWFEIPTQEVAVDAAVLDMPKLDGISVLSVEDHPQGAKEIVKSLRSMGASVESCTTCAEAMQLVRRRPFDVGVIDQGLPDGLGLDLIRDIMDKRPFMGLIMYTVRSDAGLHHSLQSLGVTYLTKPASRIGLGEAIRDAAAKGGKIEITGPTRLLIAEDTPSVRDVLQRQLQALGVEADFADDGQQALEAVRSGKYGILLTDLHMPQLDGYAVVREIRAEDERMGRHFPIIALTADVQMSQRQVYMTHGFDECLLKPVSLGQFRRLLIRWGLLKENGGGETAKATPAPSAPGKDALPPAIDKNAMIEQMGAFDESAIEMLHMFVEMTTPLIGRIGKAQKDNDRHNLKEAAHSLKGAARSAGANILGDLAARLQEDAGADRDSSVLVTDIIKEFARVEQEVKTLTP